MKRFTTLCVALGLATAGSTAFAEQPVQMTEAQLDSVVAGQFVQTGEGLVVAQIGDVTVDADILNNSVNNNNIAVPVAATVSAAVAVLGNASSFAGTFARQLGRQTQ